MVSTGVQMTDSSNIKMPNMLDRRRLKDRIVENISKAVKQIQHYQMCYGEEAVLANDDRRFQKLVENLDHALLHGLRHITNGYWVVVKEFTHKAVVRQINLLTQVTTNLGRGRAWLYLALTDHLLESYLRCFSSEKSLVRKYYVKEALVADQQQMELLLMLSAGLEHLQFQLELDVPYLDLASHIRVNPSQIKEEGNEEAKGGGGGAGEDTDDAVSLCSMESSQSMNSSMAHDIETGSLTSFTDYSYCSQMSPLSLSGFIPDPHGKRPLRNCHSLPVIDPNHIRFFRQNDKHFSALGQGRKSLDLSPGDPDCNDLDLEVIHVKVKGHRPKKKKIHKKQKGGDDSTVVAASSTTIHDPLTPESGYRSATDRLSLSHLDTEDSGHPTSCSEVENTTNLDCSAGQKQMLNDSAISEQVHVAPVDTDESHSEKNPQRENPDLDAANPKMATVVFSQSFNRSIDWVDGDGLKTSLQSLSSSVNDSGVYKGVGVAKAHDKGIGDVLTSSPPGSRESSIYDASPERDIRGVADGAENGKESFACALLNVSPPKQAERETESGGEKVSLVQDLVQSQDTKEKLDVVGKVESMEINGACSAQGASNTEMENGRLKSRAAIISELSLDDEASTLTLKEELKHVEAASEEPPQWIVRVDNNLKLLLMLQVFEEEEEKFCNMFSTSLGHTEGELEPVLALVTTRGLYLLSCCGRTRNGSPNSSTRFQKHSTVKYSELDYISLSINYQVINIVCINRRKQVWITAGDDELTRKLVQTIDFAIRDSVVEFPRLSVLTDATTQKIGMRKWAARECATQAGDVCILCYTLVHWEDAQTVRNGTLHIQTTKQGTLLYRAYTSYFMGSVWKPAHFVLKNGVLYQYENAEVSTPPTACIPLNCEQCSGCRRVPQGERNHCVEVLLADGSSLQLSAASEAESLEWLQCLCQAVAQGMQESPGASGCLPCCLVLTASTLLTCHEDLLTNFFRRLGSVNVVDITRVLVDPASPCYCLLALEAKGGRSETDYWVLYFNAVNERDRLISALDHAWTQHFQVSLPKQLVYDIELQQRCREGVLKIQQQRQV